MTRFTITSMSTSAAPNTAPAAASTPPPAADVAAPLRIIHREPGTFHDEALRTYDPVYILLDTQRRKLAEGQHASLVFARVALGNESATVEECAPLMQLINSVWSD